MTLALRLAAVQGALRAAAVDSGRDPAAVRLMAVSKTHPLAAVLAAHDAGIRDFGENKAQELVAKAAALAATGRQARWHFIGRLQRNKAAQVAGVADTVHSVDRPLLVEALAARAVARLGVFVQVNIGAEPHKGGVAPSHALDLARRVSEHANLHLLGLMTVPPAGDDPRPYFAEMAALSRALRATAWGKSASELSMGMSHDFAAAIACGATWVRVGTAIFGERTVRTEST